MRPPLQSIRKRRYLELTLFLLFIGAYMLCVPGCAKRRAAGPGSVPQFRTRERVAAAA